jgi:hypothetical protein
MEDGDGRGRAALAAVARHDAGHRRARHASLQTHNNT